MKLITELKFKLILSPIRASIENSPHPDQAEVCDKLDVSSESNQFKISMFY